MLVKSWHTVNQCFYSQYLKRIPLLFIGRKHRGLEKRDLNVNQLEFCIAVPVLKSSTGTEEIHTAKPEKPPAGYVGERVIGAKMRGDDFDRPIRLYDSM